MTEKNTTQQRREEAAYLQGREQAWMHMLQECLRHLGMDNRAGRRAAWILERQELLLLLRSICLDLGEDLSWSDDLSLVDVIEKRIRPHLPE